MWNILEVSMNKIALRNRSLLDDWVLKKCDMEYNTKLLGFSLGFLNKHILPDLSDLLDTKCNF